MADINRISTDLFPSLALRSYGDGSLTLLLLHGFPASGELWRLVLPQLADRFTVIVPDLPGVGESTAPALPASIDEIATGLLDALTQLGKEQVVVAGHSMGGYIAMAMAARAPSRIAGLSMVHSSAQADDEEKKASRRKAIELIRKGGKDAFIRASVKSLFADQFLQEHPGIVTAQVAAGLSVADDILVGFYNAMMQRTDKMDILRRVEFPVQWIIGADDSVIPKDRTLKQSSIADVNFVSIYEGCGHMSMLELPGRLAKDMTEFAVYCDKKKKDK